MRFGTLTLTLALSWALSVLVTLPAGAVTQTSPGETSGAPLAPLSVTDYDPVAGDISLSYQSGCGATDNTIYYGSLDQISSLTWAGEVCNIGTGGQHSGFNPGSGSYFFVITGNDGTDEGSYGRSQLGATFAERAPRTGNACGHVQNLVDACTAPSVGMACESSIDCGARSSCVADATGGAQCACLAPFTGAYCGTCAPGYAGPDCRSCAPGFLSNIMQNRSGGELPDDPTRPEVFRCVPDVPGDCTGRSCGGRGSCVVADHDAICACDPGFTGSDCQDCAPNYERNAGGACVLAAACREAKCGGHGNCIPAAFGEVACQCDAGYPGADCGGSPLTIVASSDSLTLYENQSIVLRPQGGIGPYSWQLLEGPARLDPCDPRGTDPTCPIGGVRLTALPLEPLTDGLMIIRSMVTDPVGLHTTLNLAVIPASFLPFTGVIRTEMVPYHNAMLKYMRARGIRAGALGVSKNGVILTTNGYGYRDSGLDDDPFVNAMEGGPLVQPTSPFRLASVTKPLTAAAVRAAAVEAGVNVLSNNPQDRATTWIQQSLGFDLEGGAPPFNYNVATPGTTDWRWPFIAIRHLLNHHVGFWRDFVMPAAGGLPDYNASRLPYTVDPNDPNELQYAVTGTSSDISYTTGYLLAALQLGADPRPTVEKTILFAAGNQFHYTPGGLNVNDGDNYANIGYIMAGRVLEGLKGETYDPDDPTAPEGWGRYPKLLQNYLCEASGIYSGVYPGDAFNPQPTEPYYRNIDWDGDERREWNLAGGADRIRFNAQDQIWEFCQGNCPNGPGAVWGTSANTASAYGGFWPAQRNSAGGMIANTGALLKFARNHRVKVGTPGDANFGTGSLLVAPGQYGSSSTHSGSLSGTYARVWQMGGQRTNNLPLPKWAWNPDPAAPLDFANNGSVLINEATYAASNCVLPSDVAVAVVFAQSQDRRAPVGGVGNSSVGAVYDRIIDFLGDATCKVNAQAWPLIAEPVAQPAILPACN